jgi:hypothetical protein
MSTLSEKVFYKTAQVRVSDRLLTLSSGTTLSIASISSVMLRVVPRPRGIFGALFGDPNRTARLFIELNTGIVHELASVDIAETEKLKAAIEAAIATR